MFRTMPWCSKDVANLKLSFSILLFDLFYYFIGIVLLFAI